MTKKPPPKSLLRIPESELQFAFCRASGPGGQYVNTTDSAVQLRYDISNSNALPEDVKVRLMTIAKGRINDKGILTIDATQNRSQSMNRIAAIEKLQELLDEAAAKPKVRKRTKPTVASREIRLKTKRFHSEVKARRRKPIDD